MGIYVYKIAAKSHRTYEGCPVYLASYAYKPYSGWGGEKENGRMHFSSGATSCDRWWNRKTEEDRRDVLVENHKAIYRMSRGVGSVYDDIFDKVPVAVAEDNDVEYLALMRRGNVSISGV